MNATRITRTIQAIANDITDPETETMSEANARLIAAAPDMLDALQAIMATGGDFEKSRVALNMAFDAIAKATGNASHVVTPGKTQK